MKKLEKLEAIRGAAAVYVIIHHLFAFVPGTKECLSVFDLDFSSFFKWGGYAVFIFFVLSGFVIQHSFSRGSDKSFKLFFYKRFARIYIPLLAVFIVTPIIQLYQQGYLLGFGWKTLIGNIFMLQDLFGLVNIIVPPLFENHPLWSLSYEWWYYMLFFWLSTRLAKIKSDYIVYPIIIISACLLANYTSQPARWGVFFIMWWLGREMAVLYGRGEKINFKNLRYPLFCIFAVALIMQITETIYLMRSYNVGWEYLFELQSYAETFLIFLAIICFALVWHKCDWKFFDYLIGPFKYVASISYGLYITHMPLVIHARYLDFVGNWYLRIGLYIIVCVAFSYFIERVLYVKINNYLYPKLFPRKG